MLGALDAHRKIKLFSFDRQVVDHPVYAHPNVSHTSLGRMRDGVGLSRLYSFVRATWILSRATMRNRDSETVVLVNSLELLMIVTLCGLTRLPTVYDVSDIHPLQLSKTIVGRCLRMVERRMLMRVRLLVVTSPWYYWEYYKGWLCIDKPALLIENKVSPDFGNPATPAVLSNRIAWNGLLRCQTSAQVLLACMNNSSRTIHLSLHGTLDRLGSIGRTLVQQPNCLFTGAYRPEALSELLSASSFVWAIDFSEGENSKWLLPYRLYSAMAAGLPVIAADGTATAEVVLRHDIGIVLSECTAEQVLHTVLDCEPATYERWVRNVHALRERALRRNEWELVFDDVSHWAALRSLPNEVDVDLVFSPDALDVLSPANMQRSRTALS